MFRSNWTEISGTLHGDRNVFILLTATYVGLALSWAQCSISMVTLSANSRKPSSQRHAYFLLSNSPQFAHVGVFNRDGKSLT
jgi:hypothetical protein